MSLATRDGLVAAIIAHSFNSTIITTDLCADFIAMTEAELSRELMVRGMTVRADAVIDAEYAAIPSDFQGEISLRINDSNNTKLQFLAPDAFDKRINDFIDTGAPRYFTIIGSEFRFLPAPDQTYVGELIYWQGIPPLTDGSSSNWLLTKHPDVYLYGCLMHAAAFLKNMDDKAMYEGWFAAAISSIARSDADEATGTALQMTVGAVV